MGDTHGVFTVKSTWKTLRKQKKEELIMNLYGEMGFLLKSTFSCEEFGREESLLMII